MNYKKSKRNQYLISIFSVLIISVLCFVIREELNYRVVALILLLMVSVIAMLYDILPVLLTAFLSAVIWNYCFIPPIFTFDINSAEDLLMFMSYFFVAILNAVLTHKIRQVEKKVRDKEEKDNSIKLYNTLLNSLSHELRTPIATILGSVDALSENKYKLSESNQQILLDEINIAGLRLNRQVENLLNISRIESGTIQPKLVWCDLNDLINSIIQKLSIKSEKTIHFIPNDSLPFFKLDGGFMEQIIHNLLHNSIVYTPENTIIEIFVKHQSEKCVIIISDNGVGFSESQIPLVFDKFYRIPHSKVGGSGLGLSIVKGFVESQKGTILLTNNENGGATFTIEIPAETSYINNLKNE